MYVAYFYSGNMDTDGINLGYIGGARPASLRGNNGNQDDASMTGLLPHPYGDSPYVRTENEILIWLGS